MALLEVYSADACCRSPTAAVERHCDLLAIDCEPSKAFTANAKDIVPRLRRCEESRPLHAKSFSAGNFGWQGTVAEFDVSLRTADDRLGARSWSRPPAHHAFVVVRLQARLTVGSRKKTIWHGGSIGAQELGSGDERDRGVGE